MKAPILETERLIIKPLSLEHLSEDYVEWVNDVEVNKYLETGGGYTLEVLRDFLINVEKKDIYFWAIHLKEHNLHIGNIKIDPIVEKHGRAEYGIMMGRKSEWGLGYAKEATLRIIDFCFNKLAIRKLTLGVVKDNIAAYNLYQNLGFKIEGVFIKHAFYQGKYCDTVRMSMFNPNFNHDE